jgi:lambda family phage portal protein
MNLIDRAIAAFSPERAARRIHFRNVLNYYEAAKPSKYRKGRRDTGSGNAAVLRAGMSLTQQARHLEQNLDLARGILDVLVQNTVGPAGIGIEPQPRRRDGSIHDGFAQQILNVHRDWAKRPETTWQHDWPAAQRLMARSMYRDGEALAQRLMGPVRGLDHGTRVPYSLEMMESDLLPMDYSMPERGIFMGVQKNSWGRPVTYWIHKEHPGEVFRYSADLKPVAASRILHPKIVDRIGQLRGVSIFASVLARLDDVKDYEESERIAAKVAASMAAFIIKGTPDHYPLDNYDPDGDQRDIKFRPGMVFDDLMPGESVGTVDTNRPNSNLEAHRRGQLRAVASGTRVTYSSAAKDYDGTYSAQRQELVEGYGAYGVLAADFIGQFVRPAHEDQVSAAIAAGVLDVPADVDLDTVTDALYIPPQMPWIDPKKEADAMETLERNVYTSGPEIIRRRGQNPRDVLEQETNWRRLLREHDLAPDNSLTLEADDAAEESGPRTRRRA